MTIMFPDKMLLEEVNKRLLEQQVTTLENSLSSTIGFFTIVLALGGILFTILVVFASWWLNRTFNAKLLIIKASESKVSDELKEIKGYKAEIKKYTDSVQEMHESTIKFKAKANLIIDKYEKNELWLNYLEERINIFDKTQESMLVSEEIQQKMKKISPEDIKNFFNDEFEGDPFNQYNNHKKYYLDAKQEIWKIREKEYGYIDFVEDSDEHSASLSESISGYLNEMKGFLETLDEIKSQ